MGGGGEKWGIFDVGYWIDICEYFFHSCSSTNGEESDPWIVSRLAIRLHDWEAGNTSEVSNLLPFPMQVTVLEDDPTPAPPSVRAEPPGKY